MNNRIKVIASHIEAKDRVADIGCDSALLSIYLAKNNIPSIAIDVRKNIIEKNIETLKNLNLSKYIDFRVGNGTDKIKEDEANVLVLAGLGSSTIIDIIKKSKFQYEKIITISNKNHHYLRKKMLEFGYKISLEEMIIEKSKFYNLIIFLPGKSVYNDEDLYIGVNHKNKGNLIKYHKHIKDCYDKYSNFNKNKDIKKLVDIIKSYKY